MNLEVESFETDRKRWKGRNWRQLSLILSKLDYATSNNFKQTLAELAKSWQALELLVPRRMLLATLFPAADGCPGARKHRSRRRSEVTVLRPAPRAAWKEQGEKEEFHLRVREPSV